MDKPFPPRLLTLETLRKKGACKDGRDAFRKVSGTSAMLDYAWAEAMSRAGTTGMDWGWAATQLLPLCGLLVFNEIRHNGDIYKLTRPHYKTGAYEHNRMVQRMGLGRMFVELYNRTDGKGWI